jgi:hypothetical protein
VRKAAKKELPQSEQSTQQAKRRKLLSGWPWQATFELCSGHLLPFEPTLSAD